MVRRRESLPTRTEDRARGGNSPDGILPEAHQLPGQRVSSFFFQPILLLMKSRCTLAAATNAFTNTTLGTQDFTRTTETKRRHALEKHDKDLAVVHALELRLGGISRWVVGSPEFEEAAKLVSMRKYQRCLDDLEGLVVARIFELTKMNRSQTGEPNVHSPIIHSF